MRTINRSFAKTRVAAATATLVPCDSAELVLLCPGGQGSRVLDYYDPGSLLGRPDGTLLQRGRRHGYCRATALAASAVGGGRRRRRGQLLTRLRRRVKLQEVVDFSVKKRLVVRSGGRGRGSGERAFVRQGEGHVLGRLVAEQVVPFQMTYRFDDGLEVLARRVGQVQPILGRPVVQRVGGRRQSEKLR